MFQGTARGLCDDSSSDDTLLQRHARDDTLSDGSQGRENNFRLIEAAVAGAHNTTLSSQPPPIPPRSDECHLCTFSHRPGQLLAGRDRVSIPPLPPPPLALPSYLPKEAYLLEWIAEKVPESGALGPKQLMESVERICGSVYTSLPPCPAIAS